MADTTSGTKTIELTRDSSAAFRLPEEWPAESSIAVLALGYASRFFRANELEGPIVLSKSEDLQVLLHGLDDLPLAFQLEVFGQGLMAKPGDPPETAPWRWSRTSMLTEQRIPYSEGQGQIRIETPTSTLEWEGSWPDPGSQIRLYADGGLTAFGVVRDAPREASNAFVVVRHESDPWNTVRRRAAVQPSGSWKLEDLAFAPGEGLVFRLEHPGAELQEAVVPSSDLESQKQIEVSLAWKVSVPLKVEVRQADTNEPLPFPTVALQWSLDGHWSRVERTGNAAGLVRFPSAPSGEAWLRLLREGYSDSAIGPVVLPDQHNNEIWIPAIPTASVAGRVTLNGIPADTFSVTYFQSGQAATTVEFQDSPEGAFVLRDVPRGTLHLFAAVDAEGVSEEASVDLAGGGQARVDLAIRALLRAEGMVVDSRTGDGLANVNVESFVSGQDGLDKQLLGSATTTARGRFTGVALCPDQGVLRFSREGYTTRQVPYPRPSGSGAVQLGRIHLRPTLGLSLQLEASTPLDFTGFALAPQDSWLNQERKTFDEDGLLVLSGLPATHLTGLVILPPWQGAFQLDLDARRFVDEVVSLPIDTGRTVRVSVVGDFDASGERAFVRSVQTVGELQWVHTIELPDSQVVELREITHTSVQLELLNHERTLALVFSDLSAPGDHEIELRPLDSQLEVSLTGSWADKFGAITVSLADAMRSGTGYALGEWAGAPLRQDGIQEGDYTLLLVGAGQSLLAQFPIHIGTGPNQASIDEGQVHATSFATAFGDNPRGHVEFELTPSGYRLARLVHQSDSEGYGTSRPMSAGTYVARVTSEIHWPDETTLLLPDRPSQQVILARRKGGLRIQVQESSLPSAGIQVEVFSESDAQPVTQWSALYPSLSQQETGPSGLLELSPLPEGNYSVRVGDQVEAVAVTPGETTSLSISLGS